MPRTPDERRRLRAACDLVVPVTEVYVGDSLLNADDAGVVPWVAELAAPLRPG